jgi:DNA-binding transcriptional MerR regulator
MAYTVTKLAKLSGVSVRTLHWYDEVGLLKPAYYGSNGYRYYEEKQLLDLQQILFFRELGFELMQIKKILGRSDFDKSVALRSHRQVLVKSLERTKKLIKTIDKTIKHIKGAKRMQEQEIYEGFDKEKQKEYEKQLIARFGEKVKKDIVESHQNVKDWKRSDWDKSRQEFDAICKELAALIDKRLNADTKEAQRVIRKHYNWLKRFWTPTQQSYPNHGKLIVETDLRKSYEAYHPQLPEFIAEAIETFAKNELV